MARQQPLKPSSALDWLAENQGKTVSLPSGMRMTVRTVSFAFFLKMGRIPDSLTPLIQQAMETGNFTMPDTGDILSDLKLTFQLADAITECAAMSPRVLPGDIVPNPDNGEISVDWMDDGDKLALLDLLGMPARKLASFRPKQSADVAVVSNGEVHQPETERTGEPEAVDLR